MQRCDSIEGRIFVQDGIRLKKVSMARFMDSKEGLYSDDQCDQIRQMSWAIFEAPEKRFRR